MTTNLKSYMFGQFLSMLNTGQLFKDITFYNNWSKHAEMIYQFYCSYFQNESDDLAGDLLVLI